MECELVNNIQTLESSYAIQQEEHVWEELWELKIELAKLKFQMQRLCLENFNAIITPVKSSRERATICFRDFYKNFYSSSINPSKASVDRALHNTVQAKLNQEQTTSVVNKAPGPAGLPVEFYKALWPTISPTSYRMAREILNTALLSSASRSSLIKTRHFRQYWS